MDAHGHSQADDAIMLDEGMDAPPIVRFDERRMHIRAYNYWASLLKDRPLPSIDDLNPSEIQDFGSHSVLLDFTSGIEDPAIAFLGTALAAQCGITAPISRTSEIPPRTLLSRLTDHYLQIIANAAPIGFEAEFSNQRGAEIMYRGIMMPFASDGDTIDYVYGVINWKEVASDALTDGIVAEVQAAEVAGGAPKPLTAPIWADRPSAFEFDFDVDAEEEDGDDGDLLELTSAMVEPATISDAELGDSLAQAREAAASFHASEGRTRQALYRAISLAHAFACVAAARPAEYAELLTDSGIAVQPRSPMTALAKLVFGATYDKTRLAEFVCAIEHGLAENMAPGSLAGYLDALPGGLKALVADVRAAKRGAAPATRSTGPSRSQRKLGKASVLDTAALPFDDADLAVIVVRREADGSFSTVAALAPEDRLTGRVYAAAAKHI